MDVKYSAEFCETSSECVEYDPMTNRGRMTTKKDTFNTSINTCIDYLKIQFREKLDICSAFCRDLLSLLKLEISAYDYEPNKGGYEDFYTFDEDTLIYGNNPKQKTLQDQDVWYLEMKGHACRMFELRCMNNDLSNDNASFDGWKKLFKFLKEHKKEMNPITQIKRIDTTLDDLKGIISKEALKQKFDRGLYSTKLSTRNKVDSGAIDYTLIESKGFTLYFGGRTSRQLCIYDKAAERKVRNYDCSREFWMRYELRHYNDNAEWAFLEVCRAFENDNDEDLNSIISELIGGSIEFKKGNEKIKDRTNVYRLPIWDKWEELLSSAKQYKTYKTQASLEADITMYKKKKYLASVPHKILAMTFLTYDDVNEFQMFLNFCLMNGMKCIEPEDIARINYNRISSKLKPICSIDAKNRIDEYVSGNTYFGDVPENIKQLFFEDSKTKEKISLDPKNSPELIESQIDMITKELLFNLKSLKARGYSISSNKKIMNEINELMKE